MQHVMEDMLKVALSMTPKCHPDIAGQGIEYAWGYAKLHFWQNYNNMTAANLENNVRATLSTEVLTKEKINKFVRKARDYKLTYLFLLEQTNTIVDNDGKNKVSRHTHERIEQIIKSFKQHRSALDADYAFIKNA